MVRAMVVAALFTIVLTQDALACSCIGPRNALEARSQAFAILEGTVVRIEDRRLPPPAFGTPWDSRAWDEPVEVEFEVRRSWIRPLQSVTVVTTGYGGGDCGYEFRIGVPYVVPLWAAESGDLVAGICSGIEKRRDAGSTLAGLGVGLPSMPLPALSDHSAVSAAWWIRILVVYSAGAMVTLACLALYLRRAPVPRTPPYPPGSRRAG